MNARGQALAEMLVVLLGLIPLWLALMTLAGVQDLAVTTQAAARYAAFDRALTPEAAATTAERVRRYVFDGSPGPVAAATRASAWMAYPGLWVDPVSRAHWLETPARVSIATGGSRLPGFASTASDAALALVAPAAPLAPGHFDLRSSGPAQAAVRTPLEGVSLPFLAQPFVLSARVSVLGQAWSADGPRHVAARVRGLAPLRVLTPVTALLRPFTPALALFEPRLREFCPGTIAPDIVPADRLVPRALPRMREYVRC
ncbi:MAG: hypothetical protein AB7P31_06695 [Steroidobacteraceae bacterium]